ncbi:MAG TPA: LPS assembly protein LptD [Methylomirabilota bacterium]|nr:LPS assembly protein LptD [Methylomirabilota bacterium]
MGISLALATATTASAQAPQVPVTVPTAGGEVTILADQLEQVGGTDNLLIATGNVEITRGTARLMADRVELNRATGDAVAQGRVVFYDGEDQLTGQRIEYNIKTGTGVVYQAAARGAPFYRLSGERMERLGESVYRIRKGVFTTCEDDEPDWSFRFGSGTADLNEFVYGTDASFWVKNIPLIPFFPFFAAAIRRERQTGFLFPKFGYSSRKGYYGELPFYWAIDDSQDLTVAPIGYTNMGEGLTAQYRYVASPTERGRVGGFLMQETAKHDATRAVGTTRQDWELAPRLWLKVDVNGVTDDKVLSDYGDELYQRSSQRVESKVFLTRSWQAWNFVGDVFTYQDLTTRRPVELYRLPELSLTGVRQPLHDLPGVLYEFEGSAVRFVRDIGSDGGRIDLHPRVSRPISLDGVATVTPFVGGRLTGYDRTVTGYRTSRGVNGPIEVTSDDPRLRRLFEAGADLETRLSRVFVTEGAWGMESMLHTIEPHVGYTWITGRGQDRLPQWTPTVDNIPDTSQVTYSLTNRLRGKTVTLADSEPVRWELFRLTLGHSYDLRNERWGDAFSTIIVQPNQRVRFRTDATYDPHQDNFPSVSSDVSATWARASGNLGFRYSDPAKVKYVQGGGVLDLTRWLVLRGTINWDLRTDTFVENRVAADLHWQCWALSIEFIQRVKRDDEIRFTLNLLGVAGPISTRVGLGALESGGTK